MEVIPSFLFGPGQSPAYDGSFLRNFQLRIGEVQEVVLPGDKRSRSGKFNEYRVFVQHRENGTATTKMYENCLVLNSFGAFADKLSYTLRADKSADTRDSNRQPGTPGKGAKVLLLCVNGESHSPIIIGGLRDAANDSDPKDDSKGHNLYFEFNGVAVVIDKEGALSLSVKGATDVAGSPADGVATDKLPSTLTIGKDGTITASTKDGKSSVVLEQSGKVTVTAAEEVIVNANKATVNASDKAVVASPKIELGGAGISFPPNGLVHGSWVEPLTGLPVWLLGGTSTVVFAKK